MSETRKAIAAALAATERDGERDGFVSAEDALRALDDEIAEMRKRKPPKR